MEDELRDEIANLIGYWDWENKTANQCAAAVLSLIDSQRCVWTDKNGHRSSGCGKEHPYLLTQLDKYCRYCGRKIEVKDGQG